MRYSLKRLAAASLFALTINFYTPAVHAMPPILPYSELTAGMQGTAYTVLDTSGEIRTFPVEILGPMDGGKGAQRMIMARTSGELIEQVGGVLQGMSGSPVYVGDRLVGALSAGVKDLSPYTFFITPIEDMTPLWSMPDVKNQTNIVTVDLVKEIEERKKAEEKRRLRAREKEFEKMSREERESEWRDMMAVLRGEQPEQAAEDTSAEAASETPAAEEKAYVFAQGFNTAGLRYLQDNLPMKGTTLLPLGGFGGNTNLHTRYDAALTGGQAMGVAIVYGDFSVGATGTVTAVDGKNVLGFGHSFMHKGNVNYFMTDADVIGTIAGQSNGMKIANIGSVIGRINQDRETGVAGVLGTFPTSVPMQIHVKDNALGTEETFGAQIAYDEDFLPILSGSIAYAAMSRVSDSLGSSTARVRFAIRTNAYEGGLFERRNMYYSAADVGQVAVTELLQAMNLIVTNAEKESDVIDVDVDVELDAGRETALLVSATPDKMTVKPGETVTFKTTIRPYRKAEETLSIPYQVPKAQPAGTLHLDIRGGGFVPVNPLMLLAQAGLEIPDDEERFKSTEDRLRELAEQGQNNEIIIAPGAAPAPTSEKEMKKRMKAAAKASERAAKAEPEKRVTLLADQKKREEKEKFFAPYVIENVIHATLKVEE
ncbi:SpoIVB peptidase S55 domain protein [Selenomonas sp. oral taxon 126]|nr:SpoIVB peptidase S55 domain protein [Selenomonas sp. oral taxon 126]